MEYSLTIPGKTMTWKRAERNKKTGAVYNDKAMSQRQEAIGYLWKAANPGHRRWEADVPLWSKFEFVFDRPKGHYGTGKNAGIIKPDKLYLRPIHQKSGDFDNLAKLIADALNTVAYVDDSQIAEVHGLSKRYIWPGEEPFTKVTLGVLLPSALQPPEDAVAPQLPLAP